MSFRDRLLSAARTTAGLAGEMLTELAKATDADNGKGKGPKLPDDEDQPDTDVQPELDLESPLAPPTDHTGAGAVVNQPASEDPKSLFWDPFSIIEQMGYRDRPSSITYGTLDAILWRMPIVQTIIQTRVNQVASFCRPQRDRYQLGFKIKLREAEEKPSPADKKWMKKCEDVLLTTGVTDNMRTRDSLETFVKKITRDSLVYDQLGFEVVPNRVGKPAEWYAVDARTLRLADTATMHLKQDVGDGVKYVQIYDGMIVAEYRVDELCFGVRNPRADLRLYGYGTSELEMLINCITSMLYAWEYNTKAFSQGVSQKGILNFKGAIPEVQMRQFRRHFHSQVAGVENAWKTPITNAEDLQWINMQSSSRDMEYNAWMDFLIKVACFRPEAKVTMADGAVKEIAEIQPGDEVLTHRGRARAVRNVQAKEHSGELVCVETANGVTKATREHPFYVKFPAGDPGWVHAEDLKAGDELMTVDGAGGTVTVLSVDRESYEGTVYNFEVDEDNTYVVDGVVVHNCAMYVIDPVEINFKYGNTGQKSGLQEASNKEKVTESKERGLRPLLQFIADCVNKYIVWPMNENFAFDFVGLDAKTQDALIDLNSKRVKTSTMVDEIRAEEDKPPLPDGKGQVILDPTWQQFSQMVDAQAQQAAEGGEGDFDEEAFANQMGESPAETPGEGEGGEGAPEEGGPPPAAAAAAGGGGGAAPFGKSERHNGAVVIDLKL